MGRDFRIIALRARFLQIRNCLFGEVLWTLGRKKDAHKVWDSALESHPEDKKILDVIKRLGA